jgi:hypothetical protein
MDCIKDFIGMEKTLSLVVSQVLKLKVCMDLVNIKDRMFIGHRKPVEANLALTKARKKKLRGQHQPSTSD